MKKTIKLMTLFLCFVFVLSGCTNASKIKQLESEIAEINEKIESKEDELSDWKEIYDEAYSIYYAPHSSSAAVQRELERTKEMMDDAQKEVNSLKREIDLLKMQRDYKEEDIEDLKK